MRRQVLVLVLSLGVVALAPVSASGLGSLSFFKTPSGKIVCGLRLDGFAISPGRFDDVVCEITTGFKPSIPENGSSCNKIGLFQNQVALRVTGRALLVPCGGTLVGYPHHVVVLRVDTAFKDGHGLRCSEAATGLTCRNRSGHGFFLSPQHWHTF